MEKDQNKNEKLTFQCHPFWVKEEKNVFRPGHLKELTDHPGTFTYILLHQFWPDHPARRKDAILTFQEKGFESPDETGIGPVGDRSRTQGFASARGAVQQNTFRRLNSKVHKALGVEEGSLHNLEWNWYFSSLIFIFELVFSF